MQIYIDIHSKYSTYVRLFFFLTNWAHVIHTVWNLLFSCDDVIKYRLHHHFSGCGGAEMEVERNREVVRIRIIPRSHCLSEKMHFTFL